MIKTTTRPLGLYLHIPFCRAKCAYCDFYSLAHSEGKMDAYLRALENHLQEVALTAVNHTVDTIYIGGGTPSYLGAKRIIHLLQTVKKYYHVAKDAEITMEANPDSVGTWQDLRSLRRAGVSRISLGVQSSDDAMLRTIGRIHTWQQVVDAVAAVRKAKIPDLSLDLIYGLPGQTMDNWAKSLSDIVQLQPQHISCYGLKLEEGTPMWKNREHLSLPDDDAQADFYLFAVDFLRRMGYEQYEISNFAQPGRESRHNMKYWLLEEYAGFGPGAHSDFGGVRYAYTRDLDAYLRGELQLSESEQIDPREREREYIMLSLRTTRGIDRETFVHRYRHRFDALEKLFVLYESHGLCRRTEGGWALTARGFLVSNAIIGALEDALAEDIVQTQSRYTPGGYRPL